MFPEMEPLTFQPRSPKFFPKKNFLFFPKKSCSEKVSYIFSKKALIFWKQKPRKNSLNFRKRKFLIFQETKLSYISEKVYSEPSMFRTRGIFRSLIYSEPWHFRTRGIFRTQSNIYDRTFCKISYLAYFLIFREMKLSSLSELEK